MKRTILLQTFTFIAFLLVYKTAYSQGWVQFGSNINGIASQDNEGTSVSLSANGQTIAVTSLSAGSLTGQVRLFEKTGSNWVQKGNSINGLNNGDASGRSISLDSAGTVIAIGAPFNDATFGAFSLSGHVRVFAWSGSAWTQKGATLLADSAGDHYGYSVSISADGNTLAIGAPFYENTGRVKVFRWNTTAWVQLGNSIDGNANQDLFGNSVSLSSDGNTLAVGAPSSSAGVTQGGQTGVYQWNGTSWTQMGGNINGTTASDNSGTCVSLAGDGKTVAIGSPQDVILGGFGLAKVYIWNNTAWVQKGSTITSGFFADQFGAATTISKDGNTLAVGATATGNGRADIYSWSGSSWQLKGDTLKGSSASDQFGAAIALSYDGTFVAVGAPGYAGVGSQSGQVKVFTYPTCSTSTSTVQVSVCGPQYTSPSGRHTWTANGMNYKDTIPNAAGCDSIMTIQLTLNLKPVVNLGSDVTSLCADSVMLNAGIAGAEYLWSNGASTQTTYVKDAGRYIVFVKQNDCISSDTINVDIKNPGRSSFPVIVCGTQYTAPSGKYIWNTNGTYNDTIPNTNGCDSIITIQLSLNGVLTVNLGNDTTLCGLNYTINNNIAGGTYLWSNNATTQNITISNSGTYFVKVTANGCTAYDTIAVTIKKSTTQNITLKLCDSNQYISPSGKIWNANGTYKDTIPNVAGCDSIITFQITFGTTPVVALGNDTNVCGSQLVLDAGNEGATYKWNNNSTGKTLVATKHGQYSVLVTKNGCSASDTILVGITDLSLSVTVSNNVYSLTVNDTANYKWLDCNKNMEPVTGADKLSLNLWGCAGATYNYAVEVSKNGCIDTSNCVPYTLNYWKTGNDGSIGAAFDALSADEISLSNNGKVMLIRSETKGVIQAFVRDAANMNWVKRGDSLPYVNGYVNDVAFSSDANFVAISSKKDGKFIVTVYQWNGSAWVLKGTPFGNGSNSYTAIAFSKDAQYIVFSWVVDNKKSIASVYTWNGSAWVQKGNPMESKKSYEAPAFVLSYLSISADGNTFVMTSIPRNHIDANKVETFKWAGNSWQQAGDDIQHWQYTVVLNVSLSADANTMVLAHREAAAKFIIRTFQWKDGGWKQKGIDIGNNNYITTRFKMSSDGNTIILPTQYDRVDIFKFNGDNWVSTEAQGIRNINSEIHLVALSDDQQTISIGFNSGGAGTFRSYEKCRTYAVGLEEQGAEQQVFSKNGGFTLFPNPSRGSFTVESINGKQIEQVEVFNAMGQLVHKQTTDAHVSSALVDVANQKAGLYFIRIKSESQMQTLRMLLQP
jgi:hypothetical protein